MPKVTNKAPFDSVTGTIEGNDRTIGRDKGLSSSLRKIAEGQAGDKNNQAKTQIYVTKAPTRGGSKNRHTRAERYCFCDEGYQMLGYPKMSYLQPWWRAVRDRPADSMTPYHIFMKICLKYMAEMAAFQRFFYCSRFRVVNDTPAGFKNQGVFLVNIPVYQADGWDTEVYLLLGIATKKGRVTYDAKMIDYRLEHEVPTAGQVYVVIPELAPGASLLIDVYSYYKGDI